LSTTRSIAPFKTPWLCQGQIVGVVQERHHRRSRPVSTQRCSARRILRQCRQSRLRANCAKCHRHLGICAGGFIFSCRSPWRTKRSSSPTRPPSSPPTASLPLRSFSRLDIERTPGADGTNSMAMITDYVPEPMSPTTCSTCAAATRPHGSRRYSDHQHRYCAKSRAAVRSKDLDYVEVNRGSYSAEFGDRTYGVFNVVPAPASSA